MTGDDNYDMDWAMITGFEDAGDALEDAIAEFEEIEELERAHRVDELAKAVRQLVSAISCPCDYDPEEGPCMQKRAKTRVEDALKEFER